MNHISDLCQKNDFDALVNYLVQSVLVGPDGEAAKGKPASEQDPLVVKKAGERLDDEGRTALHWAASVAANDIVVKLASEPYYMNPVTVDVDGITPLMSACSANVSQESVSAILNSAKWNIENVKQEEVEEEEADAVPEKQPASESGTSGVAAASAASSSTSTVAKKEGDGHLEQTVIDPKDRYKVFVNKQDKLGNTALIAAASRGNARLISTLVSNFGGADVFVQNKRGQTALHRAVARGSHDATEALVVAAKDVKTQSGMSRHRALLNAKDKQGNAALHYAAMENNQELGEMLLRSGANRDAKNNDGKEFWQL